MFNKGTVVAPKSRSVEDILATCAEHEMKFFLPPNISSNDVNEWAYPRRFLNRYALLHTERTYGSTYLDALCELLPNVEFRQTFGMSELGIVRVKSESSNSSL